MRTAPRTAPRTALGSVAFATALLAAVAGCDADPTTKPAALPAVAMTVGTKRYTLEVAADEATRERGLMDRDGMPDDHGMIFVFPDERPRGFWMHHTRFPLDILFVDVEGVVVSVHTMKAYDEQTTPSGGPAMYAVELRAGQAAAAGVKTGDQLSIPPAAKNHS